MRSPPESGVRWYFGAIRASKCSQDKRCASGYPNEGQQPSSFWLPARWVHLSSSRRWPTSFQNGLGTGEPDGIGLLDFDRKPSAAASDRSRCCCISASRRIRTSERDRCDVLSVRGSFRTESPHSAGMDRLNSVPASCGALGRLRSNSFF